VTIGRPKSDDSPEKYRESYRLYQLSEPGHHGISAVDEISSYLEWAIAQGDPGFQEGDIISVSALAKGVQKSRNTAGKSVEMLATKGMLVQNKAKSPYQIVSQTPVFANTGVVADEQISLTLKFEAPSHISRMGTCELDAKDPRGKRDTVAGFLRRELNASHDPLVHKAAAQYWHRGHFQYYLRLRETKVKGRPTGALLEITYLHLPPEAEKCFRAGVSSLRDHDVTQISLYPLLEDCGLTDMRSGRSHVTVAPTPPLLLRELGASVAIEGMDLSAFRDDHPLLKWTYGIFHPETQPMITFSVCYVHADLLSIFIRNLDVELGGPR
jgi:hypothetical protein